MAQHLPPDSATARALDPDWRRSNEVELLRVIEWRLQILDWRNTRDGAAGRNVPDPIRLPWDPPPEGTMRGDVMEWDELASFFGWEDEMARFFAD